MTKDQMEAGAMRAPVSNLAGLRRDPNAAQTKAFSPQRGADTTTAPLKALVGDTMSRDGDDTEFALIKKIAAGDKSAFREIYEAYEKRIYFFIKRRLGDPHESADVFHEVMMDVWRHAGRFEERSKVGTWLIRLAHNKSIDILRKRGRREWDELDDEAEDESPTAADLFETAVDAAIVRRCVGELKGPAREVVSLVFFEGLKYREVSECLACAEGTVKARVHRAMKDIEACVRRCGLSAEKEPAE